MSGSEYWKSLSSEEKLELMTAARDALILDIENYRTALEQMNEVFLAAKKTIEENGHLADGDVCTLKVLKDAVDKVENS